LKTTPEHTLREDNGSGESVPETTVPEAGLHQCNRGQGQDQTSPSLLSGARALAPEGIQEGLELHSSNNSITRGLAGWTLCA
jgi:hypothetical protein